MKSFTRLIINFIDFKDVILINLINIMQDKIFTHSDLRDFPTRTILQIDEIITWHNGYDFPTPSLKELKNFKIDYFKNENDQGNYLWINPFKFVAIDSIK